MWQALAKRPLRHLEGAWNHQVTAMSCLSCATPFSSLGARSELSELEAPAADFLVSYSDAAIEHHLLDIAIAHRGRVI